MAAQIPVESTSIAVSAASFTPIPVASTFIPVTQHGIPVTQHGGRVTQHGGGVSHPVLGFITFAAAIASAAIVAVPKNSALLHRTARMQRSRNFILK
jgi:hypothetical protein